jgi:hypothetical protein
VQDWTAALVAYVIALVAAETEAAPVAVALSWGVAVFMVIDQIGAGGASVPQLLSNIGKAAGQPAQAGSGAQAGSETVPAGNRVTIKTR